MELWEFNTCMEAYNEQLYAQSSRIMELAYLSGMFSQPTRRPSLEHYLEKLDRSFHKKKYEEMKAKKVDVKESRRIMAEIERLKGISDESRS